MGWKRKAFGPMRSHQPKAVVVPHPLFLDTHQHLGQTTINPVAGEGFEPSTFRV